MSDNMAVVQTPTEYEALLAVAPEVLDAIPGGLALCDREGRIVRCNEEAKLLWEVASADSRPAPYCADHHLFQLDGTLFRPKRFP